MKNFITNLQQKIIDRDPGLIQFRRGIKSVIALLLSLCIIASWVPPIGIIYASLASIFASLTHEGETLREQKISMLMAVAYFTFAIGLGLSLQAYFYLANAVLILLSFWAFYMGRFGARYRNYPVAGAVFYLLSINFMAPNIPEKLLMIAGVAIAGFIMFVVYFYIWPQSSKAELSQHIEFLFARYIACVKNMSMGKKTQAQFAELEQRLNTESRLINQPYMKERKQTLETLLVKQYALYSLLKMIATWLEELKAQDALTEHPRDLIMTMLKQLLSALNKLKQSCEVPVQGTLIDKEFVEASEQFKQLVFSKHSFTGPALVYYSYLAFGFSRIITLLELIQALIEQLELL
jgi:hypothetical protein